MNPDHEFDVDTAVERVDDHRFTATVTDRWHTFAGPNGGYILAICTRAMGHEVSFPDPLAVSAHFLRPPKPGPAEVRTEPIRSGRRHAFVQASLAQEGKEIARALAAFADLETATGRTLVLDSPPELPSPDECLDPLEHASGSLPRPALADRLDVRVPEIPGWLGGEPTGDSTFELWMRFRDGRRPDSLSIVFLVDAAAPAVLELGEFASSTIELTVHVRARPATEWLACRQSTRYLLSGYHDEDMEMWDGNGTLVAQARQLALLG